MTVLVSVVVLVAAAVALGLVRQPEYTAKARLAVGPLFVDNPAAVPGVLQASQALASNYSRMIGATAVLERAHRVADVSGGSLAATPIAGSTLITVSATADSADAAVRLANAGSAALARYVNSRTRTGQSVETVLAAFTAAALDYEREVDAQRQLDRSYQSNPTDTARSARDLGAAATQAALLRRDALGAAYQRLVESGISSPTIESFSRAAAATSDRRSTLQLLVVIAVVSGLAIGAALALLRGGEPRAPLP